MDFSDRSFSISKSILAFVTLSLLAGCVPGSFVPPAPQGPVTIVVSGDTKGWLVPCGCTSNQSGGLLRRSTYVEELRQTSSVVLVDAGGAPGGTSPYDLMRFEAMLRGEVDMRIAAHNLGIAEAAFGAKTLRELQLKSGVPFLSANLVDAEGRLLQPAFQRVSSGGLDVAIIGVTSTKSTGEGIHVLEPKPAVLKTLREFTTKPDRIVVLAYLPEQELEDLARQLPEVTAVIGGPTGQAVAPRMLGPTIVAAATNKGKFLVELPLNSTTPDETSGKIVELGPAFADHDHQVANLKHFLSELAQRDFTPTETSFAPAKSLSGENDSLAGSESCRDCHAKAYLSWQETHHAAAWQTLIEKEFQVDPYCQQCHTTGYGRPGGFVSAKQSAEMGGVGCESCHGPSRKHVEQPKTRTPWNAADRCLACHDHENSPTFEFETYWEKIRHGSEVTP